MTNMYNPASLGEPLRELIGGRDPVALLPPTAAPNQLRIKIYDRRVPDTQTADAAIAHDDETWQ